MTWLHTWTGLVVGWVLFAVFLTGTLAYFQHEITQWMMPEVEVVAPPEQAIEQVQTFLSAKAMASPRWSITLPSERERVSTLYWRDKNAGGRGFVKAVLDGQGKEITLRDTRGGNFLYRFHFDLHYVSVFWARWFVGICSMFMLVAIITGIIIHKKIFKDFFTLQLFKGPRSWLDAHTLTSVLALPFHLMITYTGLVTLMLMYLVSAINLSFSDRNAYFNAITPQGIQIKAVGEAANMLPFSDIYLTAQKALNGVPVAYIEVLNPGDKNAIIKFYEAPTEHLLSDYRTLTYSAVTGELLENTALTNSAEQTRKTMINLHAGRFADTGLRWMYFLSGVMGTLMVATGLILWFEKRQKKLKQQNKMPFGHKLVSGLNAGFILGLPAAVAVYLLSNRLLPVDFTDRAQMEIHCFFATWFVFLLYPILRGASKTWRDGALINAVLFFSIPFVSVIMIERHLFSYQYPRDWTLFIIDLLTIFSGLTMFVLFNYLKQRQQQVNQIKV
ncbi:PepSY domain-containing protein [Catenovulum sp. 2E275]|uniref:PepSY-associated TM helix domain-containing protein n=1 Tax=Catenovulum sp. 2E275 TaxID=2980497 RepID=UPI0021CE311C|nr:PepSY-associated TM helix domain-containing protein [Catenovulum sp. 2E275]MCU4675386.1 PepSY domain-containing protein [Catenovulum sp. 2E275]